MGKDFSQAITIGNLVDDPEMRLLPNGTPLTRFRLAVGDDYYDKKAEEWVNRADFFSFVSWGRLAESVAEGMAKGDKLMVVWRPKNSNYTDKDGKTVYQDDFVASSVQALSKKTSGVRGETGRPSSGGGRTGGSRFGDDDGGAPF